MVLCYHVPEPGDTFRRCYLPPIPPMAMSITWLNSEGFDKVTKLRSNLAESLEESSEVKVREIAEAVFGHNTAI